MRLVPSGLLKELFLCFFINTLQIFRFFISLPHENTDSFIMKTTELLKKLHEAGCTLMRHGANHDIWYSPITGKRFPVPRHTSKEVASGTLKDIAKKSGIEM